MQYTRVVLLAQITAFATGMNVTLINETPLPLQVYSVDPATHKYGQPVVLELLHDLTQFFVLQGRTTRSASSIAIRVR